MSLTAPPQVQDPVPCEVDDAVIKEAKRRARRRRWSYGAVVAAALATVAAFLAWYPPPTDGHPPAADAGATAGAFGAGGAGRDAGDPTVLREGFVGLPPEGAAPSSPTTGDLVLQVMTRTKPVWVYQDGRMISFQRGAALIPEAANDEFSGFLEQHLTPEGVEMLRSYLVDNAMTITPSSPDRHPGATGPLVRVGDQISTVSVHGCGWVVGCPRISFPETWLPASAWTDRQYRAYVPSGFEICYGGSVVPDGLSPGDLAALPPDVYVQPARVELVRAALPAEASALLSPVGSQDGSSENGCAVVGTADARIIDRAMKAAGVRPHEGSELHLIHYTFGIPPAAGQTAAIEAHLGFQPVLPHGATACTDCA